VGPAVDHRDTGASTRYPYAPPYITVDLAEDAVGVLDAHGIEGAQTWGVSLGGMIIPAAADQSP
jgi:pimeloyl-ACP methyl ester carboxylesterase